MHPTCTFGKDETSKKQDPKIYIGMIGSLLYMINSRYDIMSNVSLCARFQSNYRESHITIVKRIFIYMKRTTSLGFLYNKLNYN